MTTYPDPAELFPDVAALGSLAAALRKIAAEHGLELGDVRANERSPISDATVESTTPRREALGIGAAALKRIWCPTGWGMGISLISGGWTDDLVQVARVAHEWRAGTPLTEIRQALPFVKVTRRGEAAEHGGPAAVVDVQWESMLMREAGTDEWPQHRALIEAAHAAPTLRQLYPYTSMWTLHFSTTTGYPFSPGMVALTAPRGKGPYRLKASWRGPVLAETASPEEAVALAVAMIPDHIGPAIEGPYPYPEDHA
ncbi:DUF6193 family natural product biosynthesis protein [Phytomonospora sp. NPDC050363]|uniref:DUF6193 family natural product biosynthesis protein n=1 Tax=Phytomonospora sp. NPDC050363 TaxID=3155642 RepID=UPI0033ED6D1D